MGLVSQVYRFRPIGSSPSLTVLSEWSDGSVCAAPSTQCPAAPALQFVSESVLQGWCRQAQWIEEALEELRGHLEPQLQRLSLQIRGRALGECQVCSNTHIPFLVTFFSF